MKPYAGEIEAWEVGAAVGNVRRRPGPNSSSALGFCHQERRDAEIRPEEKKAA